jgi:putative transposase
MKISRFTDSQIMAILKQNEAGASVPDLCREHGISSASVYKWRAKFGGMDASLMKRMKELEDENRRLKKCTLMNGLRPKSPRTLLQKSGEASSATRTGLQGQSGI